MGMDDTEAGPLPDGADLAVCCTAVEALAVVAMPDRPLAALSDRQVDRPGDARDQRDHSGFVPLADDAERAVTPLKAKVLGVGCTGFAHPQAVEAEEGGQWSRS